MAITRTLTEDTYLVTYEVGPNQSGVRLDSFLKDCYRKRSREAMKRAISSGAITLTRNQGPHVSVGRLKPGLQLIAGDEVLVLSERKPEPEVCFDYRVLFEDETLFVIEKPANLPVHPAGRYFFNTLLMHLRTESQKDPRLTGREYFLIHRLDKETSGVLVLTKDRAVATHLTRQFAERKTEKTYLAIVKGTPPDFFEVNLAMKRQTESLISLKMITAPESDGGATAFTAFKRLETTGNFSLVECYPKTGRQHQIRLHLEAAGHPIVGDKLYGLPEAEALRFYDRQHLSAEAIAAMILPRHALHAAGLKFEHPQTLQRMDIRCPLPKDLADFLDEQRRLNGPCGKRSNT